MKSLFFRQVLLLVGLAFIPALAQTAYYREKISWNEPALLPDEVRLEDARAWGDSVLWIDARPTEQFEAAHIPGAISLNEDRWNELLPPMLATWSPDKHTVVYCSTQSCALSHDVAKRLRDEAQLKNVVVLHGGWEGWLQSKK